MTSLLNIFSGLDNSNDGNVPPNFQNKYKRNNSSSLQSTSLSQGDRFLKYQNKIKNQVGKKINYVNSKEGFTPKLTQETKSLINQYTPVTSGPTNGFLNSIDAWYNSSLGELTGTTQEYNNENQSYLARVNSSNPYLNTNIRFTTGQICYVTNQGVVKWYPNQEIWQATAGNNGCPISSQVRQLNIPWIEAYNTQGATIPTTPNLITGTPMTAGQSCGNEGSNVFVNTMIGSNVTSSFQGCYADNAQSPTMTFLGGAPPPAANVIQNGNFSYPSISANSYQYIESSTVVPGWDFNNGVLLNNSGAWGYPIPYPNGNQCVSIQMTGSISQSFTLPSGSVTLTFMACGRDCCDGSGQSNPINVLLNDNVIYTVNVGVGSWTNITTNYTVPASGEYTITFQGTWTQGDRSTALQNIQLIAGSTSEAGTYTQQTCQQAAEDGGYQYFALQNVDPGSGMGYCGVTNNFVGASQYGLSTVTSGESILWQSNTSGTGNSATLNSSGSLAVLNSAGTSLFSTPVAGNSPPSYIGCYGDGPNRAMTTAVLSNGQTVNGNAGQYSWSFGVQQCEQAAQQNNFSYFGLQDSTTEGQAVCFLSNDLQQTQSYGPANNCTQFPDGNVQGGAWSNSVYSSGFLGSNFWLQITDAGLIAIYRGSNNTDNQGTIWSYQGSPGQANPTYAAENGLNGQNWISSGTSLAAGDFIGSPTGVCALIMQSDGNLTFITFSTVSNCSVVNGYQAGGPGANAIYQLSEVGIQSDIGNMAYIDENGVLSQYPTSNVQLTDSYTQINNYDSPNSNISGANFDNATVNTCQAACNLNDDCYGFSIINGVCYPKNNTVYPYGSRQPNSNSTLYVRGQGIIAPPQGVTSQVNNINSVQYQNYVASGKPLANSYGIASATEQEQIALQQSQNTLNQLGQDVAFITDVYEQGTNAMNAQSATNVQGVKNYVKDIKKTKKQIKNFDANTNVDGILLNSDITVLQQNYNYMFWSILAIGTVIVSMNISKK